MSEIRKSLPADEGVVITPHHSEPAREAVADLLSHLKLYVMEKLEPDDADMLHDRMSDVTAAFPASPAPAASGVCETCNGHGMVGGWSGGVASIDGGGGYVDEPCPDCTPAASGGLEAVREDIAKIVYSAMKWAAERAENGKPPAWVERGNSLAQVEARRFASDIAALSAPPALKEDDGEAVGGKTEAMVRRDGHFLTFEWQRFGKKLSARIYEPMHMKVSPALADLLAHALEERPLSAPPATGGAEPVAWQTRGEDGKWFDACGAHDTLRQRGFPVRPLYTHSSAETGAGVGVKEHPDDLAVDRFAAAMKAKLAKKRDEGRGGWEDKADCSNTVLTRLLREHVDKGDPVDVGNLAMMIHQRGERIG